VYDVVVLLYYAKRMWLMHHVVSSISMHVACSLHLVLHGKQESSISPLCTVNYHHFLAYFRLHNKRDSL